MTDDLYQSHLPATSMSIPMPTHTRPVTRNFSLLTAQWSRPPFCAPPVIAFTIALHVSENGGPGPGTPPLGTAYGALITWAGLRLAAPRTASRLPEILTAASKG
ncbi:hypothetical protein RKD20_009482 [Streptomyces sp. SLBN-8D4]